MLEIEKTMYLKTPEALYLLQKILINENQFLKSPSEFFMNSHEIEMLLFCSPYPQPLSKPLQKVSYSLQGMWKTSQCLTLEMQPWSGSEL